MGSNVRGMRYSTQNLFLKNSTQENTKFRGKRSLSNTFKIIFSLRPNLYWHAGANVSLLVFNVVVWLSRSVGNGRPG